MTHQIKSQFDITIDRFDDGYIGDVLAHTRLLAAQDMTVS